ncbi:TPA: zinc finger-like domain-containing protein [Pseudomonas aeruginosa]|uniref:zinc finger-like domain-containing protein n=1 Tax=Pseudomonas aeruginosa TaxID=287 RepID=UPI0009E0B697|nr:zinc finger-like domain-containing protein [Pseudomonas aeruginosa]HCF2356998.1 zinc finger-like domain-containing protein [Pseudomonas aeruginosa]HCL4157741.1 zinc finger-like domain-containing protein [Pseudomonas aeruginosa]HEK1240690.1 zinc finger-like domain-containing protein [Pseudomonas aeruginosa]
MDIDVSLKKIEKNFSNKQNKLLQKIEKLIGREASIGLISLQGSDQTSQAEIEVIAVLIAQFQPIKISSFQETPRHITLEGYLDSGHPLTISPQYKVKNTSPNSQPWAVDLVLHLNRIIGQDTIRVSSLGIEYDGYPSHYIESNIKKTYLRDTAIASESGIQSIRISPESWKRDPDFFKKAIRKYFNHSIKTVDQIQLSTLKVTKEPYLKRCTDDIGDQRLIKCPLCNGRGELARSECPICRGMCSITESVARIIDISEYDEFPCPNCQGINCSTCRGVEVITREKALSLK